MSRPRKAPYVAEIGPNAIINSLVVADMLHCSDQKAMDLMREGRIVAKQEGKSWLTTRQCVLNYLESKC